VEVKRAFRKYLGPDDPGPFMDMINSMSFGCRHMKEFNRNGVFCLTGNIPEGRVKLMRVGDIDYIWTYGEGTRALYIILIPDLLRGFVIPVTLSKGDYAFGGFAVLEGGNIIRYEFDKDYAGITGSSPRQQYMPYIFKMLATSHVSVGDPGSSIYPDPVNDWHNKFYVLDCTGDQSGSETLWKPPEQVATVGFGEDLLPPWYAMSPLTAHGYHWCYEAAIDQEKRLYSPVNTDVTLGAEDLVIPDFTVVSHNGLRYNFLYPVFASRFFGKNAYDLTEDPATGRMIITAFAESIYLSGVVTATVPEGIDPILFFWPWIPYLDEIRSFNLLYYAGRNYPLGGGFEGWFMTPSLATFKKWGIGYYTNLGAYQTQELSEDAASFSNVTKEVTTTDSSNPTGCSCGDCGTGVFSEYKVTTTPEYSSSGSKTVPIGLIGGKIPITMKTNWEQSGSGPLITNSQNASIVGNYPWNSLHSGSVYGLDHWYETCCVTAFLNTHDRVMGHSEVASNILTLQQVLKVGDDVIFSGESSMHYEMAYFGQDSYHGTINGTVVPPDFVPPVCAGSISFTTQQMSVNQTQNLSWNDNTVYPAARPCEDPMDAFEFTWSLSGGGSLSSTTSQATVYTAPATNPDCEQNVTISLMCNGVAVDTLEIAINNPNQTGAAYVIKTCVYDAFCTTPCPPPNYQPPGFAGCAKCATAWAQPYKCDGSTHPLGGYSVNGNLIGWRGTGSCVAVCSGRYPARQQTCVAVDSYGAGYGNILEYYYGIPVGTFGLFDVRTAAQKAAGCCPAVLL